MRPIWAIAVLTWKAAFRYRLFWVVSALLLASVVGLPLILKDDGTARGFTQILLTYTLSAITGLLGLCTLWLACGTLARDLEECQIQLVAVKPVARWKIWLGKWLGLVSLSGVMLLLAGGCVYGLLFYRASTLPEDQQAVLFKEVLVARGSARPPDFRNEIAAETDRRLRERLAQQPQLKADLAEVRRQIEEQVKAEYQIVPPGYIKIWQVDLGLRRMFLQQRPMHLRIKFNAAATSETGTFTGLWQVGMPESPWLWRSEPMSLAPDTFHEFEIPPDLWDDQGRLTIAFLNANNVTLLFPLDEGIEVLYWQGGFLLNYLRGLGILYCWIILLATLGLSMASFLSFPVAAFVSLAALVLVFGSGTIRTVVTEGTLLGWDPETEGPSQTWIDKIGVPVFKGIWWIIQLAKGFAPIDALSTGRSVGWTDLARAVGQIVGLLGGLLAAAGIWGFQRRELATATPIQ
ncbi:MAG: ABC transporter permease [Verrucomicrobiota bacterium]|nr:ABC transporter permease [Limisphaera sp.]MDW8381338.1 ABC transporter permease [Verrucomicrobiota bacterium]